MTASDSGRAPLRDAASRLEPDRRAPFPVGSDPPLTADAGWLAARYLTDRATVAAIAAEAGCSNSAVWLALRRHHIRLRGVAGRQAWGDTLTYEFLAARRAGGHKEVGREVGCHSATVREWRAYHGLLDVDAPLDRLAGWYADGVSIDEVARRAGVGQRTARRYLLAAGVQLRPPGRPRAAPKTRGLAAGTRHP